MTDAERVGRRHAVHSVMSTASPSPTTIPVDQSLAHTFGIRIADVVHPVRSRVTPQLVAGCAMAVGAEATKKPRFS